MIKFILLRSLFLQNVPVSVLCDVDVCSKQVMCCVLTVSLGSCLTGNRGTHQVLCTSTDSCYLTYSHKIPRREVLYDAHFVDEDTEAQGIQHAAKSSS